SHELRTPLANLKAELELALRRPRDEAGLRLAIRSAAEETDRLIQLAQDLLVLARADQGEVTVHPQRTDLSTLLVREASTFEARAAERDITIEVDCPAGLTVEVDAQRMRQAIGNLLDNAIRHSPLSGEVEVSAQEANEWVKISVADSGEGFAGDFVPHAFKRFSRGDAGRSRSAGGVGLGLAVVHAVIQAHGGTVEISALSPGGLVTLTVPAATS
ncbi:MAG: ATP-binding protein, partial [Candidatus Nanopelagicales bacterium]